MANANKTLPTDANVETFVAQVEPDVRREDARKVIAMMHRVTGEPAKMWGPSIIGFGSYHYRYESGREGDMCRVGFSPRKAQLVFYLAGEDAKAALLPRLGKHKTGKGCLYISKLADVDESVLEELVRASLAHMDATYPD